MEYKEGDIVYVVANSSNHGFMLHDELVVVDVGNRGYLCELYDVVDSPKWTLSEHEVSFKTEVPTTGARIFDTGASRNSDKGKLDFEGFLSPKVLEAFGKYMHKHRELEDGSLRDSDNWQKGIPLDAYMKSMWRHFFDVWSNHRGIKTEEDEVTNLCAVLFNTMGMLHEKLKDD